MKTGIIVTGLPASGKTTIARDVARAFEFAFLDKDDFLEALYDRNGVASWEDRKRLSRQSDTDFQTAAIQSGSAVLVSHWRPLGASDDSGTPTDWIAEEYDQIVEICCRCSPHHALKRFQARTRHPGHRDRQRDPDDLRQRLHDWEHRFPLGIGQLLQLDTEADVDVVVLVSNIRTLLGGG